MVANTTVFVFKDNRSGASCNKCLVAPASLINEVRNDLTAISNQTQNITLSKVCQHRISLDLVATLNSTTADLKLSITRN